MSKESELLSQVSPITACINAEFEASQMYLSIAENISNPEVKKILIDIAREEQVHAGEFLRALAILSPEQAQAMQKGFQEAEQKIKTAVKLVDIPKKNKKVFAPLVKSIKDLSKHLNKLSEK